MNESIRSMEDLGLVIRAVRRDARVRLDDLAGIAGVSKQFVSDAEYGKSTVRFGLVLKLLDELGIPLSVELPDSAVAELAAQRQKRAARLAEREPGA